ncbi:Oxysterol-binding protein-related protein 8 [Eumeta japonica]|uniref:Oxysterol-binding protein n=1 Tax=Eumeta variegata TaxID=151549 RepID=A0A4C1YWS6_EUMVA|nr:Oxysterol-binding protein-related protein 8 [Eumeta japonica]
MEADPEAAAILKNVKEKGRRRSSLFALLRRNRKKIARQYSEPVHGSTLNLERKSSEDSAILSDYRKRVDSVDAIFGLLNTNGRLLHGQELAGAGSDSDTDSAGGAGVPGADAPGAAGPAAAAVDQHERRRREAIAKLDQLYVDDAVDDIGVSGELVEEVTEENKSLLWFLVKQVRPGMDLSKVVLPTFILEPRSFLDKLSDNYYHADLLASASLCDDPYSRFKGVLRWYLSGMYKKPRGLKKPYNPVLGEIFRCRWRHPNSNTYTYYIAEQVSHHPPVSAFYITNRREGFVIQGSLLARSKFYGNSTSAILEGCARVYLLRWGETYITTAPYAQCKGIVIGTLSMELGGKVVVLCPDTGYSAEIEFKLKSFLGGSDQTNAVSGKIKKSGATIATLDGYWDGRIDIREKQTGEELNLIDVASLKEARLKRSLVRPSRQQDNESQKLWARVSEAIANDDQITATEEKTVIEEAQRDRSRKMTGPWIPKYFHRNGASAPPDGVIDQGWLYNHSDIRVWEPHDILEYEDTFVMRTLRATPSPVGAAGVGVSAPGLLPPAGASSPLTGMTGAVASGSRHSQPLSDSDSRDGLTRRAKVSTRTLKLMLANMDTTLKDQAEAIDKLTRAVGALSEGQRRAAYGRRAPSPQRGCRWKLMMAGFVMAMVLQAFMNWLFVPRVVYKDFGGSQQFQPPTERRSCRYRSDSPLLVLDFHSRSRAVLDISYCVLWS